MRSNCMLCFIFLLTLSISESNSVELFAQSTEKMNQWLAKPQNWERDVEGPIISLGQAGSFDDTHIFAPMVALENDRYQLWFCGSPGTVAQRVFRLGMATSADGRHFKRYAHNPVFEYGDGKHSVLTPTLLRNGDGTTIRESGKLRMWFSSTWFEGKSKLHTFHESTSRDGINWGEPSPALLENIYAPTVIKSGENYDMWFTDVTTEPWIIRHASSKDGLKWEVTEAPCLVIDQEWERTRLFYPTVLKTGDQYLMWYGSYWAARPNTTALGFAVSLDGRTWHKHQANPVFRPDETRPWESHYVTSQSLMRLQDGSLRIWYASRTKPPFVNKYFAINTAIWKNATSSISVDTK